MSIDLEKAVERAFGLHPADAVLAVDEVLHDIAAFAAALQHLGAERIALRRQRGERAVLREARRAGVVGDGDHLHLRVERDRMDQPANAPARHRPRLGEGIHDEQIVLRRRDLQEEGAHMLPSKISVP